MRKRRPVGVRRLEDSLHEFIDEFLQLRQSIRGSVLERLGEVYIDWGGRVFGNGDRTRLLLRGGLAKEPPKPRERRTGRLRGDRKRLRDES